MSSPMRLLHLCYGKRCEYRSCNNTINLVRPEFGMFYCSDCLTRYGTQDVSSHRNVDFFLIDRAAKQYKKNDSRRIIVWKRNLCDISGLSLGSHREEILVSSLRAVSSSLLLEPFQKALSKANKIALLAFLVLQSQHHFYMTRYERFLSCSWVSEEQLENMKRTDFVARGGKRWKSGDTGES
eukprot:gene29332-38411_t